MTEDKQCKKIWHESSNRRGTALRLTASIASMFSLHSAFPIININSNSMTHEFADIWLQMPVSQTFSKDCFYAIPAKGWAIHSLNCELVSSWWATYGYCKLYIGILESKEIILGWSSKLHFGNHKLSLEEHAWRNFSITGYIIEDLLSKLLPDNGEHLALLKMKLAKFMNSQCCSPGGDTEANELYED